jgi:hypothetical protein
MGSESGKSGEDALMLGTVSGSPQNLSHPWYQLAEGLRKPWKPGEQVHRAGTVRPVPPDQGIHKTHKIAFLQMCTASVAVTKQPRETT